MSEISKSISRRNVLAATAAGGVLAAATVAQAAETIPEPQRPGQGGTDPGPRNVQRDRQNPDMLTPPATDQGTLPNLRFSFSDAHTRITAGGWTRQVTVEDFPISKDIAGVNMRLTAGGIRELHWHEAAEWGLTLSGKARLTALDLDGRGFVKDVVKDDLWFFPPGVPHSIQGLEPDGVEFLLVFDNGNFSEGNTTLVTDWLRHVPPEVLAKNWGVAEKALDDLYTVPTEGLFIFQKGVPGPLEDDQKAIAGAKGVSPIAFDFPMHSMAPTFKTKSGEVRVVDAQNFPVTTTSMAHVIVKPGGLRELHWHPNANEWSYFLQGKGRMTVFFTAAKARTMDFNAGDIGYVPQTFGHYVENIGDTDLIFIEMFKASRFQDLSLSTWVTHAPAQLVMDHLRISAETLHAIPQANSTIVPS